MEDCITSVLQTWATGSARDTLQLTVENSDWFLELAVQDEFWRKEYCLSCTLDGTNYVNFTTPKITVNANLLSTHSTLAAWDTCATLNPTMTSI